MPNLWEILGSDFGNITSLIILYRPSNTIDQSKIIYYSINETMTRLVFIN